MGKKNPPKSRSLTPKETIKPFVYVRRFLFKITRKQMMMLRKTMMKERGARTRVKPSGSPMLFPASS